VRILCTNYEYPPIGGGGGAASKGLAEALARLGHRIDVVTSGMKDVPGYEETRGVHIHRVRCIRRYRHYVTIPEMLTAVLPIYRKALELAKKDDYAVNHTHFILPSGLSSYMLWKATGIPYVISMHGSDVPGYNPDRFHLPHILLQPLWRQIVRNAKCLITPSAFLKELVEERVDARIEVVPYGIEFPEPGNWSKENRILVVTRMFARKGVQFFLEALRDIETDWEILIAGDGPYLPRLREMASNMGLQVSFLGFLGTARLSELYDSSKIFVFPSVQENFPVVLLEAMNAGCAVITTSAPGCAEVVQDAAIKVRPASAAGLRKALEHLLRDNDEIDRLSRLGRQRVAMISPESIARTHERIFARCAR
jgi:glycosyltransferase involved in cell wall biosynthesis